MPRSSNTGGPSRRRLWRLFVLIAYALARLSLSGAHESSTSYLRLELRDNGVLSGSVDLGVLDLYWRGTINNDRGGRILWSDIEAARSEIASLVSSHVTIDRGSRRCSVRVTDVLVTRHVGEAFLSLPLAGSCGDKGLLAIRSTLFFTEDAAHRTLLDVRTPAGPAAGFLAGNAREWRQSREPNPWGTFAAFVIQGLWHVWTGYDHLAFLLSLLLPCALTAAADGWRPVIGLRPVLSDLLRIVTTFTVAHSITLGLATLHVVTVSARTIEPLIAVTIVMTALLNLFPQAARLRLPLAFSFGLIHGFGFALALSELAPVRGQILALLAGFNIGVELAQLSVVLLAAPTIVLLRRSPLYAARLMPAASLAVALTGFGWLAARLS